MRSIGLNRSQHRTDNKNRQIVEPNAILGHRSTHWVRINGIYVAEASPSRRLPVDRWTDAFSKRNFGVYSPYSSPLGVEVEMSSCVRPCYQSTRLRDFADDASQFDDGAFFVEFVGNGYAAFVDYFHFWHWNY